MKHFWSVFGVMVLVSLAAACQQTPSLAGTWTWSVTKDQAAQAGWSGDLICENAGNFRLLLATTGSTTLTQSPVEGCGAPAVASIVGTWQVSGDQLTYHEITDSGCGEPTAVYKWKLEGNTLTLTKVSDTCQFSASDTAPKVWTKAQ